MPSPENKPRRRQRRLTLANPIEFPVGGTLSEAPENDAPTLAAPVEVPLVAPALPDPPPPEISDADLGKPPPRPRRVWTKRQRTWFATSLGLLVGVPLLLTVISALTSPPHVSGVPTGHLVYLEADSPSEHTTTLRGLYVTGPEGGTRLLVHETEPQDVDGGIREWITQPVISPDGTRIAFEKQLILLQEEKQTVQNEIWVMPLTAGDAQKPHLVLDLTKKQQKQVVGMAWDSDSSLLLLEDETAFSVPTDTADEPLQTPLDLSRLTLATAPDVSATRSPALTEIGGFAYEVQTPNGPQILIRGKDGVTTGPAASLFALSPTGDKIAFVPPGTNKIIRTFNVATGEYGPDIPVRWGWSVFGRRQITALHWSPDGNELAFTVSKPPIPDDELFYVDSGGNTWQLPYRTGRAAWDWGR